MKGSKAFDPNATLGEQMDSLLGLMGVGSRSCTYVPAEAVEQLRSGEIEDYHDGKGVFTVSHGPYLDDWSKVPAEIAAKYNTSPSYAGDK